MKRRICFLLCCLVFLCAWTPLSVNASEVYGHLYFAGEMLETNSGQYLALQDRTRNAFFLGSISPDSAWIAYMITDPKIHERLHEKYGIKFPGNLRPVSSQIDDVHQVRPTQFALQLLESAKNETERAFAIGWLSHYIVDSYIHDLINHYGGFVTDPTQFDDPAMKVHDKLEALEMRHVFELRGDFLRKTSREMRGAPLPESLLQTSLKMAYPGNSFYEKHSQYFLRTFRFASELMIDSTRWYSFQSEHSPAEIATMKKLIHRFRPQEGKLLDVLTDLPSRQDYQQNLLKGAFLTDWPSRSEEIQQSSRFLMDHCAAYYWWKDRQALTGPEMPSAVLSRIEGEMRRINPADDLIQPRQIRNSISAQLKNAGTL